MEQDPFLLHPVNGSNAKLSKYVDQYPQIRMPLKALMRVLEIH